MCVCGEANLSISGSPVHECGVEVGVRVIHVKHCFMSAIWLADVYASRQILCFHSDRLWVTWTPSTQCNKTAVGQHVRVMFQLRGDVRIEPRKMTNFSEKNSTSTDDPGVFADTSYWSESSCIQRMMKWSPTKSTVLLVWSHPPWPVCRMWHSVHPPSDQCVVFGTLRCVNMCIAAPATIHHDLCFRNFYKFARSDTFSEVFYFVFFSIYIFFDVYSGTMYVCVLVPACVCFYLFELQIFLVFWHADVAWARLCKFIAHDFLRKQECRSIACRVGSSDPFVKLSLTNSKQSFKSKIQKKTLSPNWDESFSLCVETFFSCLSFAWFPTLISALWRLDSDMVCRLDAHTSSILHFFGVCDSYVWQIWSFHSSVWRTLWQHCAEHFLPWSTHNHFAHRVCVEQDVRRSFTMSCLKHANLLEIN